MLSAPCPTGCDQFAGLGVTHLLQTGEDLLPVYQHRQFTLFGTTFDRNLSPLNIFFQLGGQTGRQLLLTSGCTVLDHNLHRYNSFRL